MVAGLTANGYLGRMKNNDPLQDAMDARAQREINAMNAIVRLPSRDEQLMMYAGQNMEFVDFKVFAAATASGEVVQVMQLMAGVLNNIMRSQEAGWLRCTLGTEAVLEFAQDCEDTIAFWRKMENIALDLVLANFHGQFRHIE